MASKCSASQDVRSSINSYIEQSSFLSSRSALGENLNAHPCILSETLVYGCERDIRATRSFPRSTQPALHLVSKLKTEVGVSKHFRSEERRVGKECRSRW